MSVGAKFCASCGMASSPLVIKCGNCGSERVPNAIFCGYCGFSLEAADVLNKTNSESKGDDGALSTDVPAGPYNIFRLLTIGKSAKLKPELPEFAHPIDRDALTAMFAGPGFERALKFLARNLNDKERQLEHLSTALKVGPNQCSDIWAPLPKVADFFGIDVPELYVQPSSDVKASSFGTTNHRIVITTDYLELLTDKDLEAVLAQQCGHIVAGHTLYKDLGNLLAADSLVHELVAEIPTASLVFASLAMAYDYWSRYAELTADRAAAIYFGNAEPILKFLMKHAGGNTRYIAEINLESFIAQGEEYLSSISSSKLNKFYHLAHSSQVTQPLLPVRAAELTKWTESSEFASLCKKYEGGFANIVHSPVPLSLAA